MESGGKNTGFCGPALEWEGKKAAGRKAVLGPRTESGEGT